jgi:hypothetical protein
MEHFFDLIDELLGVEVLSFGWSKVMQNLLLSIVDNHCQVFGHETRLH